MTRLIGLIIVLLTLQISSCIAQKKCPTTLGDFYHSVKTIKAGSEKLKYKACAAFDFKNFLPIEGMVNKRNYFELGYNSKNEIREIIHYDSSWMTTKLIVNYFDQFKILQMQHKVNDEFGFTPVAFFISEHIRFMVNFEAMTGKDSYQFGVVSDTPDVGPLDQISCVMFLDENLYPTEYYTAHKGIFHVRTQINYYGTSSRLKDERVQVLFTPADRLGTKIQPSLCVTNLSYKLFEAPDMVFTAQPLDYKENYPLWIYCGASWYK